MLSMLPYLEDMLSTAYLASSHDANSKAVGYIHMGVGLTQPEDSSVWEGCLGGEGSVVQEEGMSLD